MRTTRIIFKDCVIKNTERIKINPRYPHWKICSQKYYLATITSNSEYPATLSPCVLLRARSLTKRGLTGANSFICHEGLLRMLENSPSLTNFHSLPLSET